MTVRARVQRSTARPPPDHHRAKIRDGLRAVKDYQGLLISYTADADGELAHTMGIYRNKGKVTEQIGTIKAAGF